jgi:hypothetical protein
VNSNVKLAGSGILGQEKKGFKEILSSRSPTHASKHDPSDNALRPNIMFVEIRLSAIFLEARPGS